MVGQQAVRNLLKAECELSIQTALYCDIGASLVTRNFIDGRSGMLLGECRSGVS